MQLEAEVANLSIHSLERELSAIDGRIKDAVAAYDVDLAAQLTARKAVIPQILDQMRNSEKELKTKIQTVQQTLPKLHAEWEKTKKALKEGQEEQLRMRKHMADVVEPAQMEAEKAVYKAEKQLIDLQGELKRLQIQQPTTWVER